MHPTRGQVYEDRRRRVICPVVFRSKLESQTALRLAQYCYFQGFCHLSFEARNRYGESFYKGGRCRVGAECATRSNTEPPRVFSSQGNETLQQFNSVVRRGKLESERPARVACGPFFWVRPGS